MNKPKISALLIAALAIPASAKEISPQEALTRAGFALPAHVAAKAGKVSLSPVYTAVTDNGAPAVYVFNNAGDGYFLLSADDAALPVLGYADRGSFSVDGMPPQMQWWLSEYARQIEFARDNNLQPYSPVGGIISRAGEREDIAPMLHTCWDQVAPYNNLCPLSGTQRTWTGCVATAMAQVMNYWSYPEKGNGSITYTIEDLGKKVSMNFGSKKFDWDNMLDIYANGRYSDEEADAVAYLMKACGYSVKTQYSMDASGSLGLDIGNALVKYFDYDPNVLYTLRWYYSAAQWDDMMYENLKNVGPVIYGGNSALGGGHCFVCDGYDADGYYHFNWGWSGMSDGYFVLDALDPGALGTGGGGGGYNFIQEAVFGIQPPTGKPAEERPVFLSQYGELAGSISGDILYFNLTGVDSGLWINNNPSTLSIKFGAMFYPQGEQVADTIYHDISDRRFDLRAGYGVDASVLNASVDLSNINLPDGTYKVVVGSVPVPKNTISSATDSVGFVAVRPSYGCSNFVTLKVEDGKYYVSNHLLAPLKVQGEILGNLYFGTLARVRLTVENPADVEQKSGFAPVFFDSDRLVLLGESIYLSIPPHSTVTREWDTELTQLVQFIDPYLGQGIMFSFFNEVDYSYYIDSFVSEVVLNANPGVPSVRLSSPMEIAGSFTDGASAIIPDCSNINISGELSIQKGYFNYPLLFCLCKEVMGNEVGIVCTVAQNLYLSADDPEAITAPFDVKMSYPLGEIDKQYYIVLAFEWSGNLIQIANIPVRFADPASVATVENDRKPTLTFDRGTSMANIISGVELIGVEVYDISGRKSGGDIAIDGKNASVRLAEKGVHIISVEDIDGRTEIFKILN